MNITRAEHRRRASRRVRRRRTISAAIAVALIGVGVAAVAWTRVPPSSPEVAETTASATPTPTPTPSPTATPLTPAQSLLASSSDPNTCAVSFAGDGITLDPQLQAQGARYQNLPIPHAEGRVFAGWYEAASDATALTQSARRNGAGGSRWHGNGSLRVIAGNERLEPRRPQATGPIIS